MQLRREGVACAGCGERVSSRKRWGLILTSTAGAADGEVASAKYRLFHRSSPVLTLLFVNIHSRNGFRWCGEDAQRWASLPDFCRDDSVFGSSSQKIS